MKIYAQSLAGKGVEEVDPSTLPQMAIAQLEAGNKVIVGGKILWPKFN